MKVEQLLGPNPFHPIKDFRRQSKESIKAALLTIFSPDAAISQEEFKRKHGRRRK